ncbi:outer membrane protein assembly factor BamD [Phyllobacterium sp. 22229]|uniref:Outer membrane protein assembly factor BamD n=1 Tax=Phyllobacterium myrsinacearum TaxID=28101 RepID=A0A2S9JX97_9HYPH|nr:outer membrane protein assembly factor BamD [Phyllobacterium myrsinacearum]PRD57965.1 outer membrane protein assembly factor BamD [Phyllobacterium myrsinacearum]
MSAGFGSKARLALLMASVAGATAISGCASNDKDLDLSAYVDTIEPADVLYNQALANLNAGRLDEAAKKFDAVDRQHPYSEFARKALVMGAFANYRAGKYDDSLAMTKRYIALYPTQPEAAYAYYITGLCYYRQIPDVTREQSMTRRSIAAFNEVVERFPQSEYVDDSKEKIRFGRDQLAGKEMQVGRYYLERKEYLASIKRFRGVVEQYSNTRHVEEALARLTEAYYALGLTSEAQSAAAVLGQNYPDSQWYKDSYKLLQSGGLEPRQNAGSWLSQAAQTIVGGKKNGA